MPNQAPDFSMAGREPPHMGPIARGLAALGTAASRCPLPALAQVRNLEGAMRAGFPHLIARTPAKIKSGSHWTRWWREPDSNLYGAFLVK